MILWLILVNLSTDKRIIVSDTRGNKEWYNKREEIGTKNIKTLHKIWNDL